MFSPAIESNAERRHAFILVMPVAERPQQLEKCLVSLDVLLARHPYPAPIELAIVEDSLDSQAIAAHAEAIARGRSRGLRIAHLQPAELADLPASARTYFGSEVLQGHRGQAVARNLGFLWAWQRAREWARPTLIWSIDSDQLFCLDESGATIDYFSLLDRLFATTPVLVATGKVVGDPPVSPAVMTGHFLADLIAFLDRIARLDPASPCAFHETALPRGAAAYHDMADLFGFAPAPDHAYSCPLAGAHTHADCFAAFSQRVMRFWRGEHPTRATAYVPQDFAASIVPARTVYAGNYVFRAEQPCFIPFAELRLRMSGPTLGRILKAELGDRFVSANFPLFHRRASGAAGFRPGVMEKEGLIDIADEYERQFWGDVLLFTFERHAEELVRRDHAIDWTSALTATANDLLARYQERQQTIGERLSRFEERLASPSAWWRTRPALIAGFRQFAASVRHNFLAPAPGPARIGAAPRREEWLARLAHAIREFAMTRNVWRLPA